MFSPWPRLEIELLSELEDRARAAKLPNCKLVFAFHEREVAPLLSGRGVKNIRYADTTSSDQPGVIRGKQGA
jgi:hypothetical protein